MRLPTVALTACLAGLAATAAAEDRFGPTRAASVAKPAPVYENTALLHWNSKTQGQPTAENDLRDLQPQPLADGLLRNTSASPFRQSYTAPAAAQPAPMPQAAAPQSQAAAAPTAQPAPANPPRPAAAAPLPTSLFDAAPEPTEATASTAAVTRARVAANAANVNGQQPSRIYSVHSGYGMTPDPISLAQTGVGQ